MSSVQFGVALSATLSLALLFGLPAYANNQMNLEYQSSVRPVHTTTLQPSLGLDPSTFSRYQALGITIEPDAVAPPYFAYARHLSHAAPSRYESPSSTPRSAIMDADRFMVMLNDVCGYVDPAGRTVIRGGYKAANTFHEGFASVAVADPDSPLQWGLIDRNGRWVIPAQYQAMGDMAQGLVRVMDNGKWGYMNAQGRWVIPAQYEMAYDFSEGYARVFQDGHWGLVTQRGDWALHPEYDDMAAYGNGLIPVFSDKMQRWLFMSLDRQRMMVTKVEQTLGYKDGYAPIKLHGAWGLMDQVGTLTIPNQYREVGLPSEGLVPVQDRSGLWGYMTAQGRWVIAPSFEHAESFRAGHAWVTRQGEPQYIDHSGNTVMPATVTHLDDPAEIKAETKPVETPIVTPSSGSPAEEHDKADDVVWTPPSEA